MVNGIMARASNRRTSSGPGIEKWVEQSSGFSNKGVASFNQTDTFNNGLSRQIF